MQLSQEEYYTPPTQEIFDDIKQASIKVWETYDDTHGYATVKINRIKDIKNVADNYGYIIAMFDSDNQLKVLKNLERNDSIELMNKIVF